MTDEFFDEDEAQAEIDSDLSRLFAAAADHVSVAVTSKSPTFASDQFKLELYGLYKQATAGPCKGSKPGIWNPTARSKWEAWNRVGPSMSAAEAMGQYVELVKKADPLFIALSRPGCEEGGKKERRGMGPVFSSLAQEGDEEEEEEEAMAASVLHELAYNRDVEGVRRILASRPPSSQSSYLLVGGSPMAPYLDLEAKDEAGCTALHIAADRGVADIVKLLIEAGAQVEAKDEDGLTALKYAELCGHKDCVDLLTKRLGES